MAENYTVTTVMETGKSSPTYGTEYHVKFAESEQTFQLWFKKAPLQGDKVYGNINGNKFKKEKKEFEPTQQTGQAPAKRTYQDNSDGQRQGMCINNAAQYINAQNEKLTPSEWAESVRAYAQALYGKSDLAKAEVKEEAEAAEISTSVQEIFGVTK